jgi:23S rRNA (guanine745-N1)-methyltransferase
VPLRCTVRGCDEPLRRCDRTFACTRGHTFDIARSGYVNLLQPQDRRSPSPGDTRDAVEARARLIARGIGRSNLDTILEAVAARDLPAERPIVVDLGCGGGDALHMLSVRRSISGVGIDLSAHAADLAARRYPSLTWVVANADRQLPLLDGCVSLVMSVHARRNPAECRRVLAADGLLLVATPAADDLIELREAVQGERQERDRVTQLIADHAPGFTVVERRTVREIVDCDRSAIADLLRGTYRGERRSETTRVEQLDHLRVTLASDVVLFARADD